MQTFTGAQAKKRNFTIFMQTIIQLAYPPKLVFAFSWDDCNTWEKLETMVMQSSAGGGGGGQQGGILVYLKKKKTVLLFISFNVFQCKI